MVRRQLLGDMLVQAGYINRTQADECLVLQNTTGRRVGEIFVEKGYITQEELMRVLESQHKVPFVELEKIPSDPDIAKTIPIELARANTLAPVKVERGVLYVAIDDPKNFLALDEVRAAARMEVQPMLAGGRSIELYIDRIYGNIFARRALSDFNKEINYEEVVSAVIEGDSEDISSAPIVRLVNALLEQAVGMGASDIHVEPLASQVRIRMRVDGTLSTVLTTPLATLNTLIARVKVLGDLNIAERRAPQDGRFNARVMNRDIDVRLSIIPTVHGEKAVMRLLDRSTFLIPKERLGFTKQNLEKFDQLLSTPHGIILITGPTGSGKSTTLYTMLDEMNNQRDNIVTIEDPVEYIIDGLNQIPVNPRAGVDFALGLRAILRQDPDIIMIGEIRDSETADIAIRSAITGHLVLSTIHTNDAVSSIYRLVDMGIPSYMVSASLVGIISQRLVRVICPTCRQTYNPTHTELTLLGISPAESEGMQFYKGFGCPECNHSGYKGRMAVHEILVIDHIFRDLVHNNAPLSELRQHALNCGMVPLRESALNIMLSGKTTLEEVVAITHGT